MEFIERRDEASNDPVFGRVGEMSKSVPRKYPRGGRQTLPPVPNAAVDKLVSVGVRIHLPQIRIRPLQCRKVLV